MVGALKKSGMQALYPYDGAVNAEKFVHYVENKLKPILESEDVVIMDNCSIHHAKIVKERLCKLGISVLYLPPYSPELNPIEEAWSKIKSKLRRAKVRNIVDYITMIEKLRSCISVADSKGFFRHAQSFHSIR